MVGIMYKSVRRISILKCLTNDVIKLRPRTSQYIQIFRWNSGLKEKKAESLIAINDELSFASFLQHRQDQARRSYMVRVPNIDVRPQLIQLCRSFGKIKKIFYSRNSHVHVLLVEMETEDQLISFLKRGLGIHQNSSYQNHFLKLNLDHFLFNKSAKNSESLEELESNNGEQLIEVMKPYSQVNLNQVLLREHKSLSELIMDCYEVLKVNDFEIRKRFLMCRQIEVLCSGVFPNAVAYPFGSSVTGLGFVSGDLDVSLVPHIRNSDAFFMQENYLNLDSNTARVHLATLSELMKNFMVGCSNFFFVKNARVPIVKYKNSFTDVECDLSLYNLHGIAMSHILYILGSLDSRIKALVVFIKLWAGKVGVVIKSPSSTISNFSLSLLVIFFLQQVKIIPPWKVFPCNEKELVFENIDFSQLNSFLTDYNTKSKNDKTVGELFKLFFEYYENFDFNKWGINIYEGEPMKKVIRCPLYIDNPLLHGVNVSKNVNFSSMKATQSIISDVVGALSAGEDKTKFNKLLHLNFGKLHV